MKSLKAVVTNTEALCGYQRIIVVHCEKREKNMYLCKPTLSLMCYGIHFFYTALSHTDRYTCYSHTVGIRIPRAFKSKVKDSWSGVWLRLIPWTWQKRWTLCQTHCEWGCGMLVMPVERYVGTYLRVEQVKDHSLVPRPLLNFSNISQDKREGLVR